MIGVLVSGEGTNLQALLDDDLPVVAVASSADRVRALDRARAAGVPADAFSLTAFDTREARDAAMADWLEENGTRIVVCAGFMELLTPGFLDRFPGRVVNVHPSLLPAFAGTRPIEEAIEAGVTETGVTVHFVDEGVDTGPIIAQERLALLPGEDVDALRERLHAVEHRLLPRVVRELVER
jgi:phosphoribosylglycinamide formyltransferase-1